MKKLIILIIMYFIFLPNAYAIANKTTYEDINSAFDFFRNQLIDSKEYLVCDLTGTTCSQETNVLVELLKKSDYEKIYGKKSYINNRKEILINDNDSGAYITKKGEIGDYDSSKSYYTKAVVYVGKDTTVTGTGSKSRPYKFSSAYDLSIIKMYKKDRVDDPYEEIVATPTSGTYELTYDCKNRAYVEWVNYELVFSNISVPVSCTFWFSPPNTQ